MPLPAKVLGEVEKLADKKLAVFIKCKKTALKNGATSITACATASTTPARRTRSPPTPRR
jgi:hypothetical protein